MFKKTERQVRPGVFFRVSLFISNFAIVESNNLNGRPAGAEPDVKVRSIYERAGSDGAWLGLWFTALFGLSVVSMRAALVNVVVLAMALMVPFIAYRFLRRTYVDSHGLLTYSAIWMQGILTFAAGSLILCAVTYVFMRWIYPDFILDTLRMGIEFYRNEPTGAGAELAGEFQTIIDRRLTPSPFTVSMVWMWLGLFSGSVLSMFLAMIVRVTKVPVDGGGTKRA